MKLITDNKWKDFKYGYDVPQSTLNSDFDWLSDDEKHDGFIFYQKRWYHISEFMRHGDPKLKNWHGVLNDSFFSGIAIHVSEDGDRYKIATFIGD